MEGNRSPWVSGACADTASLEGQCESTRASERRIKRKRRWQKTVWNDMEATKAQAFSQSLVYSQFWLWVTTDI